MTSDHHLADELVKLATLLRMGMKPNIPPHVRYLLHACHHEITKPDDSRFVDHSASFNQTYTRPIAVLIGDPQPSANFRNYRKASRFTPHAKAISDFDPEYDITLRIHDRLGESAYLDPDSMPF